jgi:protein TonB
VPSAFALSLATHIAFVTFALIAMRFPPPSRLPISSTQRGVFPLAWSRDPGPGGGGGGGGNRRPEPRQQLERIGKNAVSVPQPANPSFESASSPPLEREPIRTLIVPVVPLGSAAAAMPGSVDAPSATTATGSLGSGGPDGAGTGLGSGDGPGKGPGLRDGRDGGTGGKVYQPGNGVTMPIEIRRGVPQYTPAAVRARAQGAILVECVVQPSGTCTNFRVKRSISPAFGLEEEAIKAASQWRFKPGLRDGQPVPVLVTIEIVFAIR